MNKSIHLKLKRPGSLYFASSLFGVLGGGLMLVAIVGADSLTNLEFGLLFVFGLFIAGLLPLAVSLEFRAAVSEKPSLFVKKDLKFIIDSSGKALDAQKFYQFWETSSPST